jgi:lysozyme
MTPARKMQLIFSAAAIMVAGTMAHEGWVLKGYKDPVRGAALPTACDGVTEGVVLGKAYTEDECIRMSMLAKVKHAAPLAQCIEKEMPAPFLASMVDTAYNVGVGNFHKSAMCRQMKAGNYPAACDAILLYNKARKTPGGPLLDCNIRSNNCYGVIVRRKEQRKACLEGLK